MTDTLPPDSHIGRVALRVETLDETIPFYRDVIGLAVRARDGEAATLGTDEVPLIELREAPDAPARPNDAAGLFHTAVRVPTRVALADALERIRGQWRLSGASDHLVSEALYLSDPEGNGVEVYCDRPRSEWETTDDGRVAMTTDPLDLEAVSTHASGTDSVPSNTDIGHVHLEVTSLSSARAFYAETLGLAIRQETRGATFLAAGEYHHHVGCNVWNGRSAPASGRGLSWFEVVVPDAASLTATRERFEAADVDVSTAIDGRIGLDGDEPGDSDPDGFAVVDPDGIELRLRTERST